jgi:hypothetical protein
MKCAGCSKVITIGDTLYCRSYLLPIEVMTIEECRHYAEMLLLMGL